MNEVELPETEWTAISQRYSQWVCDTQLTPQVIEGARLLEQAADIHLVSLYRELDLHALMQTNISAEALAAKLMFADDAAIAIESLLLRLAHRYDFLVQEFMVGEQTFRSVSKPRDRTTEMETLKGSMTALGDDYIAPLEFLEFGAKYFVHALRDNPAFMDRVLTGKEPEFMETWDRATNTDPLQDVHGTMGARAVAEVFEGGAILEVGGGTGNGIRNILQDLDGIGKLASVERYVFTDVSMNFILQTRHQIRDLFPDVPCEWRHLDINAQFTEQKIPEACANLVYGVNAAHIAKDTVTFIKQCAAALQPGGKIVFSERVRLRPKEMVPRELVLNLSSYHRTAAIRNDEYRVSHAYLTVDDWIKAFQLAGVSNVSIWPDPELCAAHFPENYAVVIVGQVSGQPDT